MRMRDPYEVLGVPRVRARRRSRAPSASSPRSCTRTPTSTIPRRPRASPRSTPPTRSSATTTSARRSTAARSTPRASRASRGFEGAAQPAPARAGRAARISRASPTVPTASSAAGGGGGGGGFEDMLRGMFGGGAARPAPAARARPSATVRAGGFRRARHGTGLASLAHHQPARGGQGVEGARPSADRQGDRGQDSRRHRRWSADQAQRAGAGRAIPARSATR